ncbi:MAG: DUF131 domain-containing protein [Thermoplasmata archaeon]|nr:DUF131 domain-containing protein [Thermoplasmata archaeon]
MKRSSGLALVGVTLFLLGAFAVALAVREGSARLYLALIFPVVTGSSPLFLAGVGGIVLGFLVGVGSWAAEAPKTDRGSVALTSEEGETGGVLFVGPVPILLGGWQRRYGRRYPWFLLVGFVFVLGLFLIFWFAG